MTEIRKSGQLVAGVIVLGLGLLLGLQYLLDFRFYGGFIRLWPLMVVAVGAARLLGAQDRRQRGAGLVIIAVGVWLLLNTLRIYGLDWGESWPILLMLIGFAKLIAPEDGRRSGGVLLILLGAWASLNVFELWGLYWDNSWSIALIVVGLFLIWRALFENRASKPVEGD